MTADNPLLAPWTGPCGGVPAFDRMRLDDLEPALEAAMAEHLRELDAIADDPAPPTYENTILAFERSGSALDRVRAYLGAWRSSLSTPAFRALDPRLAARWADHDAAIVQNAALFARIHSVSRAPELAARAPEDRRLVKLVHARFARHGATLAGPDRARHAAIERRLAELYSTFRANVLADEETWVLLREDQLGGLPDSVRQAAASAAATRGHAGRYAILNTRSSVDPFLTYSADRALREQVWRASQARGARENPAVAHEILRLRAERARLLGCSDYARWILEDRMAGTPERVRALLDAVWPAAVARVREEVAELQAFADGVPLAPWDYLFYADRLRRERYALDSSELRGYLQLDRLVAAMHFVAETVFGLRFSPVADVPVLHPTARVWQVSKPDTGALVGAWYLDPFARTGKRSGAWANAWRGHTTLGGGQLTLAANTSNFLPGAPGAPVLLSWDDARVLFHEFGHALHLLASTAATPTLDGCVRDYVELQSQLLERWLSSDRVIEGFLVHHQTGEPMPRALVEKVRRAATFLQGFATTEYLASAYLDLELHLADPEALDLAAFEAELLGRLGMPAEVVPRHRLPHFAHVFGGEGYAAGYYGYLWADVLTADAAEAFAEAPGGLYDAEMGARVWTHLFAPRDTIDPAEAWLAFRGREADIGALMRERGFA